mmetsp:Transcript_21156/g.54165  ORF Transcript_21156/g.54165 Transcript_21156/m.54165 type:complete len:324 (-) Transcript_21156:289-1260(-)
MLCLPRWAASWRGVMPLVNPLLLPSPVGSVPLQRTWRPSCRSVPPPSRAAPLGCGFAPSSFTSVSIEWLRPRRLWRSWMRPSTTSVFACTSLWSSSASLSHASAPHQKSNIASFSCATATCMGRQPVRLQRTSSGSEARRGSDSQRASTARFSSNAVANPSTVDPKLTIGAVSKKTPTVCAAYSSRRSSVERRSSATAWSAISIASQSSSSWQLTASTCSADSPANGCPLCSSHSRDGLSRIRARARLSELSLLATRSAWSGIAPTSSRYQSFGTTEPSSCLIVSRLAAESTCTMSSSNSCRRCPFGRRTGGSEEPGTELISG